MATNDEIAKSHTIKYLRDPENEGVERTLLKVCRETRADELARIIKLAEEFRCCPFCGNTKLNSHWCPKCKKPFSEPDDAYRFAMILKKKME